MALHEPEIVQPKIKPSVMVWTKYEDDEPHLQLVIDGTEQGEFDFLDSGEFVDVYWLEKEDELRRSGLLALSYVGISRHLRNQLLIEAVRDAEGNFV